jgi:hypothetical protein
VVGDMATSGQGGARGRDVDPQESPKLDDLDQFLKAVVVRGVSGQADEER